ncbi:LOB domain-containing protein 11-like [Curcuma longa]|uniref:LOB domain-containing protein 11-like n=1 Tax=Curcuma longa TaxID=136217 RepID=UPI003D9E3A1B
MESSAALRGIRTSTATSSSSSPPPGAAQAHAGPCAACKLLRRRCSDKCVLAPYFPPAELLNFATAHRVFGASNIIKLLQELPEGQRADAVSSMVYEAGARVRDPIYGCTGAICLLQKQVEGLQAELARAQAELLNLQAQHKSLVNALLSPQLPSPLDGSAPFADHIGEPWDEPLWTI